MKLKKIFLSLCLLTGSLPIVYAQQTSSDAVLKTQAGKVWFVINGQSQGGEEEIPFSTNRTDTILLSFYFDTLDLKVYTDIDSLPLLLRKDEKASIRFEKDGMKPLYLTIRNGIDRQTLHFDTANRTEGLNLVYEKDRNNPYLLELRSKYPVDSVANLGKTDLEKVRKIASWVHGLWEHDGNNEPMKNDAISILEEVSKGKNFRCVEYGTVAAACLKSIGLVSRKLALKTKDVETRPSGAGHVLMEVYVNDLGKWIMVDPQWDVIPLRNQVPLNAVELQQAITNGETVELWNSGETVGAGQYIPWIYPYLYYFDVSFDNRENIDKEDRTLYAGKSSLMLVPQGIKNPTNFQGIRPIDYCYYTHSLPDFYAKP